MARVAAMVVAVRRGRWAAGVLTTVVVATRRRRRGRRRVTLTDQHGLDHLTDVLAGEREGPEGQRHGSYEAAKAEHDDRDDSLHPPTVPWPALRAGKDSTGRSAISTRVPPPSRALTRSAAAPLLDELLRDRKPEARAARRRASAPIEPFRDARQVLAIDPGAVVLERRRSRESSRRPFGARSGPARRRSALSRTTSSTWSRSRGSDSATACSPSAESRASRPARAILPPRRRLGRRLRRRRRAPRALPRCRAPSTGGDRRSRRAGRPPASAAWMSSATASSAPLAVGRLQPELHAGERRSQLVGRVRDELALRPNRALHPVGHLVERAGRAPRSRPRPRRDRPSSRSRRGRGVARRRPGATTGGRATPPARTRARGPRPGRPSPRRRSPASPRVTLLCTSATLRDTLTAPTSRPSSITGAAATAMSPPSSRLTRVSAVAIECSALSTSGRPGVANRCPTSSPAESATTTPCASSTTTRPATSANRSISRVRRSRAPPASSCRASSRPAIELAFVSASASSSDRARSRNTIASGTVSATITTRSM